MYRPNRAARSPLPQAGRGKFSVVFALVVFSAYPQLSSIWAVAVAVCIDNYHGQALNMWCNCGLTQLPVQALLAL
ncbi:hypothetical protein NDU88_006674 [Pleurodeles waltl]|uniref:Uncharacterized protein n=1 Tax=Pleurodeles waltl TaxID=8319 RepID=A0AAV7QLF5_PLEWA|nr:hypothetical protein NDU88_006674 [Pleurodeles waltl]